MVSGRRVLRGWTGKIFAIAGVARAVEFVPFEHDAAAPVVRVLQAGEFACEVLEAGPAGVGVSDVLHGGHGLAEFEEEEAAHGFEAVGAAVVMDDFLVLLGEVAKPVESLLLEEPVLVAGAAPFGEVLVGDGVAGEVFSHGFFGFGQVVEPVDDGAAHLAVLEAGVELFADVFW